jgi:hypothetical protein
MKKNNKQPKPAKKAGKKLGFQTPADPKHLPGMVELAHKFSPPVHAPKGETPAPAEVPTGDRLKNERRAAHSDHQFDGLDFTVPAARRAKPAPEFCHTRGWSPKREPVSVNDPLGKRPKKKK